MTSAAAALAFGRYADGSARVRRRDTELKPTGSAELQGCQLDALLEASLSGELPGWKRIFTADEAACGGGKIWVDSPASTHSGRWE